MGGYLSVKRQLEVATLLNNLRIHDKSSISPLSGDDLSSLEEQVRKLYRKLKKFIDKYGLEKSCYIKREHGEDISLMTEIVLQQQTNLFPTTNSNIFSRRNVRKSFEKQNTEDLSQYICAQKRQGCSIFQ